MIGFALMWVEGLAFALLVLALAIGWAARGHAIRWLWFALVFLAFSGSAALIVVQYDGNSADLRLIRTPWCTLSLTWLAAFVAAAVILLWQGLRRPAPGLSRSAAGWSRRRMWLGLGVSVVAFALTFWNLDLSARAELAIARQEAGDVLLAMTPPPVPESENAARHYAEAAKNYGAPFPESLHDATRRGVDAKAPFDWKDASIVDLVQKHEETLAILRKGAAMPGCTFDHQRGLLDAAAPSGPDIRQLGRGITLLAVDARVKAAEGNLKRSLDDISAILGIFRHLSGYPDLAWGREVVAWRTLEEVLRMAPPGRNALPAFEIPELFPLVRKTREEHALLGMVFPAAASQPSLALTHERQNLNSFEYGLIENIVVPMSRVFVMTDEIPAMRKTFEDYRKSPRLARDETPKDWADIRQSVDNDPTSVFGIRYIKPKQRKLLSDASSLATLRQTARTGYAVAAYRSRHGKYPDRLEELSPEFLPAAPTDPRDGQPLLIKRVSNVIVIYAPQNSAVVDEGKVTHIDSWQPPPIFRLYPSEK